MKRKVTKEEKGRFYQYAEEDRGGDGEGDENEKNKITSEVKARIGNT